MDRVAVFVDAGYLFAQGSLILAGKKLRRGETRLDEAKALAFLEALATKATNLPLLRIYWYDGTDSGPSPVHTSLAFRESVKVRLGIVNAFGEQKGVDSLIVTDLINLSRNGAMTDIVLLTGDEDIRVGVQQAQEFGVRVHLVGIEEARSNQSKLLRQEADTLHEITKADVAAFLVQVAQPNVPPVAVSAAAGPGKALEAAAETLAKALSPDDVESVVANPSGVPPEIDRQLLRAGSAAIGGRMVPQDKRELRAAFVEVCKALKKSGR